MDKTGDLEFYFTKHFVFTKTQTYKLPATAYKSSPWSVRTLQAAKCELNSVKIQTRQFDSDSWHKHTAFRDPSRKIVSILRARYSVELLTQAWCKFYEILAAFPVLNLSSDDRFSSLHLCEAPGAFIAALNRFLCERYRKKRLAWTWHANSLNPYYEGNPTDQVIVDDRLIGSTRRKWDFCKDGSGDLLKWHNHEDLVAKHADAKFDVITADGSVDCSHDPGEQEIRVHYLNYCESLTGMRLLSAGGTFVLKIFTIFEHGTVCLLYLLNCIFEQVHVFKPCTSKRGNSEVYVVCLGYVGTDSLSDDTWESLLQPYRKGNFDDCAMFSRDEISSEFIQQVEECARYFTRMQIDAINENVQAFTTDDVPDSNLTDLQNQLAELFVERCQLSQYPRSLNKTKLIKYHQKKQISCSTEYLTCSFYLDENFCEIVACVTGRTIPVVTLSSFSPNCSSFETYLSADVNATDLPPFSVIFNRDFADYRDFNMMQHKLFKILFETFDQLKSNVAIFSVPLLTRFSVGLIYLISYAFEKVAVTKKTLTFIGLDETRVDKLRDNLKLVQKQLLANEKIKNNGFTVDILEVISFDLLRREPFFSMIWSYNASCNES